MNFGACLDHDDRRQLGLHREHKRIHDPHPEADAWIAAFERNDFETLSRLHDEAEAKLARLVKYRSDMFITPAERMEAKRQSAANWRANNHERHKAMCRAWNAAHAEYRAERERQRRENMSPEVREAYLAAARARKARLRGKSYDQVSRP